MRIKGGSALVAALLVALVAGCGGSPTSEDKGTDVSREGASKLEAVYKKVEGLAPAERRKTLLKMAEEEGGTISIYGSANLDEAEPIIDAFEDLSDLDTSLYRASSSDLLQRVLQEAKAKFKNGADVIYTNGPEMQVLDDEKLLLPLNSPFTKDVVQQTVVSKNWTPVYLNAFTASWNTRRVPRAQAPKTWEDVLQKYSGHLAMEVGDWDWFATGRGRGGGGGSGAGHAVLRQEGR